jgi:hypothetical protein
VALLTDVLEHISSELLDTAPLDVQCNMWFLHGDVPGNFSYAARNHIETAYTARPI